MPNTKNDLSLYAEEQKQLIKEEKNSIQEILNKFPQPAPAGFLKLEPAKKNNWGSTEDLDKPLCERYLFVRENKRIWLDIPHELMEKLELPVGKTFPWPFYLKSEVLEEKEEVDGAITIEIEEELFINKPVSEKNAEKELVNRLEELESLREKVKDFENLQSEKEELENKLKDSELNKRIEELEKERDSRPNITLDEWNNDYSNRPTKQELEQVKKELEQVKKDKEKIQRLHDAIKNGAINRFEDRWKVQLEIEQHYSYIEQS